MPDMWRPEDFTPIAETGAAPDPWADIASYAPGSGGQQPPPHHATAPRSAQPIKARRDYGPATPVDPPGRILDQPDLGASTETLSPSSLPAAQARCQSAAEAPVPASEERPHASLANPPCEADSQPADSIAEQPSVLVPTPVHEEAEDARPIAARDEDWGEDGFATARWPAADAEQQHDPGADGASSGRMQSRTNSIRSRSAAICRTTTRPSTSGSALRSGRSSTPRGARQSRRPRRSRCCSMSQRGGS